MSAKSALASQAARLALGLCRRCGDPATVPYYCAVCRAMDTVETRNRRRAKAGIPFDAPVRNSKQTK